MYIREEKEKIVFEPVTVFTHEKLQERRVSHSGEKPDVKSLSSSDSKDKQKIENNLDSFSRGNQRRILEQYSEATLVYG